ncbi:hypothetical protein DICVIV_01669, partial [Dictyocaulus viviparus]
LPSGLHILPTLFGNFITGKLLGAVQQDNKAINILSQVQHNDDQEALQTDQLNEEFDQWEQLWTLETTVNTVRSQDPEESDDELSQWEKFWTLETTRTEKFSNPEKETKIQVDKQVLENFNKTIEKRHDGYYVRLPWKDLVTPLPNNRAIALKRLVSVWQSLNNNKELLDMYNEIFEEQLHLNILEEIKEENSLDSRRIHYIPHQPVLTPNKTTTKLRILLKQTKTKAQRLPFLDY